MRGAVAIAVGALALMVGFVAGSRGKGAGTAGEGHAAPPAESVSQARANDGQARLSGEIAMLKAQVAQLSARQQAGAADPPAAGGAPLGDAEARAQAAQKFRTFLDDVAASFRDEAVQPRWSSDAKAALETAMSAEGVGLRPRSIDCRTSTCRVELANQGMATQESLEALSMRLAGRLPNMLVDRGPDTGADPKVIVYYSAEALRPREEGAN